MFVSSNRNTTGATCETGTANPSWAPQFTPGARVARSLVFCVPFCSSLFVSFYLAIVFVSTFSIYGVWSPFWYLQTLCKIYIYIYTWTLSEFPNSLALSQPTSNYLTACYKFRHDNYETTSWWRQPYNVWCEGDQFWLRITLVENVMCK